MCGEEGNSVMVNSFIRSEVRARGCAMRRGEEPFLFFQTGDARPLRARRAGRWWAGEARRGEARRGARASLLLIVPHGWTRCDKHRRGASEAKRYKQKDTDRAREVNHKSDKRNVESIWVESRQNMHGYADQSLFSVTTKTEFRVGGRCCSTETCPTTSAPEQEDSERPSHISYRSVTVALRLDEPPASPVYYRPLPPASVTLPPRSHLLHLSWVALPRRAFQRPPHSLGPPVRTSPTESLPCSAFARRMGGAVCIDI